MYSSATERHHTYREFFFDSDTERSVTGDLTDFTTDVLEEEVPSVNITIYHGALSEIEDTVRLHSDKFIHGWSPKCNNSTEAFFANFQKEYINWKKFYPNTRIPRSYTTNTKDLFGCVIIEVDLETSCDVLPGRILEHSSVNFLAIPGPCSETSLSTYEEILNPGPIQDVWYFNKFQQIINEVLEESSNNSNYIERDLTK